MQPVLNLGCHVVTHRLDRYLWFLLLLENVNNQDWSHNHLSASGVFFAWRASGCIGDDYLQWRLCVSSDFWALMRAGLHPSVMAMLKCVVKETLEELLLASQWKQIFDSRFQCLKVLLQLQENLIESKNHQVSIVFICKSDLGWGKSTFWGWNQDRPVIIMWSSIIREVGLRRCRRLFQQALRLWSSNTTCLMTVHHVMTRRWCHWVNLVENESASLGIIVGKY